MCVWSLVVLTTCMFVQTPNASQFPEVDVASKFVNPQNLNVPNLNTPNASRVLYSLSNATSSQIIDKMRKQRFFVRINQAEQPHTGINPYISLGPEGDRLTRYS